jgi:hypothetical protein
MILILASIADAHAVSFAGEFGGAASVLTCNDLVRRPSRLFHPSFSDSTITVAGRTLSVNDISAVLNLLPAVMAHELSMYPPDEQAYQAAEMRALLVYFLSVLPCPVINRATPMSLTGSVQNPAAWFQAAAGAGIPLARLHADSSGRSRSSGNSSAIEVSSVGGRIVTPSGTAADEHTSKLARICKLEYLRAMYRQEESEMHFAGADSYPDIRNPRTRTALSEYLLKGAA